MSKTSQTVSWKVLPLHTRDIDFFERQRNLFSTWLGKFDEDWKNMRYKDSQNRFEHQLENIKRDMHKLDSENDHIYVSGIATLFFVRGISVPTAVCWKPKVAV